MNPDGIAGRYDVTTYLVFALIWPSVDSESDRDSHAVW